MYDTENQYGMAAIVASTLATRMKPQEAWTEALKGTRLSIQSKSCPKNAFLGLCGAGFVVDVPRGIYGRNSVNAGYAVEAVRLLLSDPNLTPLTNIELWRKVMRELNQDPQKKHNGQMDVVLALYQSGHLQDIGIKVR